MKCTILCNKEEGRNKWMNDYLVKLYAKEGTAELKKDLDKNTYTFELNDKLQYIYNTKGEKNMTRSDMKGRCFEFFSSLANSLSDSYELVGSYNKDVSVYLIPTGTIDELSYYGKPKLSFRVSDHWNWYSNLKKCKDKTRVQCRSMDMPWARHREDEQCATKPRYGWQVAVYGNDGVYHHVFGEKFNRKTKEWSWEEKSLQDVLAMIQ